MSTEPKCWKQRTYSMVKFFRCTYKKQGGDSALCPPLPALPIRSLSTATFRPKTPVLPEGTRSVSLTKHQPRVTSHGSHPPVHNRTAGSTLSHVYCLRAILPSLRPGDRPFLLRRRPS